MRRPRLRKSLKEALHKRVPEQEDCGQLTSFQKAKEEAKKILVVVRAAYYDGLNEKLETPHGDRHLNRLEKPRHRHSKYSEKSLGIADEGSQQLTNCKRTMQRWDDYLERIRQYNVPIRLPLASLLHTEKITVEKSEVDLKNMKPSKSTGHGDLAATEEEEGRSFQR